MEYREYKESDIPSLIKLWKENSEWGEISENDFKEWHIDTPYEKVEIIVAIDSNEGIVGQMMFTPCRIHCNKNVYKAARISAPILHKDFRTIKYSLNHPILKLYINGMSLIKKKGFDIAYVYPDRGWLTALRGLQVVTKFRWETKLFECSSIDFKQTDLINEYSFARVTNFSNDYDLLFNQVCANQSIFCGIVRTEKWLTYKLGGFINYELREKASSKLLGYISVRPKDGLLVDFLFLNNEVGKYLLNLTLNELALMKEFEFDKLLIMKILPLFEILKEFDVNSVDYKFGFGYCILNPDLRTRNEILLNNWYNMPLD